MTRVAPSELAGQISARLRTAQFGRPLQVHALVTSTNDVARELASARAGEGTTVLALEQSRGRGRLGRTWQSPPGGLYLSVVLRPRFSVERWPLIGLACALGAAAAAETHAGAPVLLKWPNDLLLDGKKLGGVLVETTGDAVICGIGLNVSPSWERTAPPDSIASAVSRVVPAHAAWLAERNPSSSLPAIASDLLLECEKRYGRLRADPLATVTEWRAKSATLGGRVFIEGTEPFDGIAEDIDTDGALLVRTTSGLRRVVAGDVSLRVDPPTSPRSGT